MEPFFFVQAADTQLGLIDRYFHNKDGWQEETLLITKMITAVNAMDPKPAFLIICGDMVNEFPDGSLRSDQLSEHKRLFSLLSKEVPLVCVCGNHDVGDTPTPTTVANYRRDFGPDYLSFVVNGVLMIVINSQYYADRSLVPQEASAFDTWLDQTLLKVKDYKQAIVFQHIPWFLRQADEEKEYFNIEVEVRMKMLNKLYDSGIRSIFCGHYHRNAGGHFKDLQLVVTSAVGAQLGTDKSGLRIVTVTADAVSHEYYDLDSVPTHVSLT